MKTLLLISSPRKKGNCASVATFIQKSLNEECNCLFLEDFNIKPCIDCGYCATHPSICSLDNGDNTKELFQTLEKYERIFLISPIYFYHAPAHTKAFIDRAQRFWSKEKNPISKDFYSVFVAARPKGEKISQGYELTLKYFAPLIQANYKGTLTLYGLEAWGDFDNSTQGQNLLSTFLMQHVC